MLLSEEDRIEFQRRFPQMRLVPSRRNCRMYEGEFRFRASSPEWGPVEDSYQLRIVVLPGPRDLPETWETAGRVARIDPGHVNPGPNGPRTGSLCLGSYLRLKLTTGQPATLVGFATKCVVPYLYAISLREQGKPAFVFGELAHGEDGLLQDYEQIFGVSGKEPVIQALRLSSIRRRVANRAPCPCGCGKRLGLCTVHNRINELRAIAPRNYFASLTDGHRLTQPVNRG